MKRQLAVAGRITLVVGALTLLAGFAACGDDSESGEGKSQTTASAPGAVDPSGRITIVGKDTGGQKNAFAPVEFTAKAGQQTTVTLQNQGTVIHNFALKEQKGADGQEIQTKLIPAGQSDTVSFTLGAGTYEYYCTVHVADMTGKMTVQQ